MIGARREPRPALAATVHDPGCHFLPGLRRLAAPLGEVFGGLGVLATTRTAAAIVSFLERELGAAVSRAPDSAENIGAHRREAVRLASTLNPSVVLYADLDHVLRWIEADRTELERHLAALPADLVVIGRTARAMQACPRRLRDTEAIVNHIYHLATGRSWDLMFATRAMSPRAARFVVEHCTENSIANDVEWPLRVEYAGLTIAYREADGLSYRITADFDADTDAHDDDPIEWAYRLEYANRHAQAFMRILGRGDT
jgi:hypothetical protein